MSNKQTLHDLTYDVLDGLRNIASNNSGRAVFNSFSQPTTIQAANLPPGIQFFDFDTVGRQVFLEHTPLINKLPRSKPRGGTAIAWREITDINVNKTLPGVSEGKRGGTIDRATRDKIVTFSGLGIENVNTFEAKYAAQGVANPKALARLDALKALRMAEERVALYANRDVALTTPAKPTVTVGDPAAGEVSTTTGRANLVIKCVALTGEGRYLATLTAGVSTSITRTNADGTTDTFGGGSSAASVASDPFTVTAGQKITAKVADVRMAFGYAWYMGAAGSEKLVALSYINEVEIFADENPAAQAASTVTVNNSTNALEFNGLLTIASDPNSNAYYRDKNATELTADGAGNIQEFVEAFYHFSENYEFGPSEIQTDPLTAYCVTKILLAGPAAAIYAKMLTVNNSVQGGFYVSGVLNPFTGQVVPITVHPYMPKGTAALITWNIPYPIEDLGNILEIVPRQPYYVIEWPLRTRKDEVGVYVDETLKCELAFAQGVIKNIKTKLK